MTELGGYLHALFGGEGDDSYVETRWKLRNGGMGREFVTVRDRRLPELVAARAAMSDVFIGVAPRSRQDGIRAAVDHSNVLWADCDGEAAVRALTRFKPVPSMVVGSGTTCNCHAYWPTWPPVSPDELERANRRIAYAIGADMRSTDAPRILRPAGTFSYKGGAPVPVTLKRLVMDTYTTAEVTGTLADPPSHRPPARPECAGGLARGDDPLATIAPAIYFEALTGLVPDRAGKVSCPLHEDRTPSCHVYPDPGRGWYCYGCGAGGRIYDLAAHLSGYPLPLRGDDFLRVRDTLTNHLAVTA